MRFAITAAALAVSGALAAPQDSNVAASSSSQTTSNGTTSTQTSTSDGENQIDGSKLFPGNGLLNLTDLFTPPPDFKPSACNCAGEYNVSIADAQEQDQLIRQYVVMNCTEDTMPPEPRGDLNATLSDITGCTQIGISGQSRFERENYVLWFVQHDWDCEGASKPVAGVPLCDIYLKGGDEPVSASPAAGQPATSAAPAGESPLSSPPARSAFTTAR
ncbi:MAG: hypothetical protein M1833_000699 [Piccolia ochrophora]|nr:MAG: hypothetical protein M1833_000699 [Piccolia ochrophora]